MTKRAHPLWISPFRISPFWISSIGLLLVATLPALCPALVRAQGKSDAPQSPAMSTPTPGADTTSSSLGQANEQSALELVTLVLKLNDSQQEQLHAAFNAALKEATPIADEMEHAKNALFAAARSGKSEEEIRRLADEQGQLTSRMLFLQAQTFAKLWALLDSQQKALADDFVYSNIRLFLPSGPQ
jgi:hypothetical protein